MQILARYEYIWLSPLIGLYSKRRLFYFLMKKNSNESEGDEVRKGIFSHFALHENNIQTSTSGE